MVVREVNRRTERTRTRSDRQRSHHAVFPRAVFDREFSYEHDTRQMRTSSRWNRTVHVESAKKCIHSAAVIHVSWNTFYLLAGTFHSGVSFICLVSFTSQFSSRE